MNINKVRRKYNRCRVLKAISYLLGFPLFVVLAFLGSVVFMEADAFADVKYYAVILAAALWLVSVVLQIVISLISKSYNGRTLFMLIVTLILLVGGSAFIDMYVGKKIDDINAEYEKYGVQVEDYKYQVGWVTTWTSRDGLAQKWNDEVVKFTTVYNIGYKSSNYGGVNGDGSKYTYDKEADANYSANGLYADGYIFGFKQAVQVLIDYNQAKFDIEHNVTEIKDQDGNVTGTRVTANGKDADEELEKALQAVNSDSEWIAYKRSAEYVAAYGEDGKAYRFMLNAERLDQIIQRLSKGLDKSGIIGVIKGLGAVGFDVEGMLKKYGINVTLDELKSLTLDKALEIVNGLNLFAEPVTADALLEILEDFSYYQDPSVRPKFDFIKDETIKRFAYANYYATVHGANVGSVLIAKDTVDENGVVTEGRIGAVSMNGNGYPNSFAYSLEQLYELQAKDKVAQFYPLLVLRRYMIICVGIIALTTVLFYGFKRKEDLAFEMMKNA